MSMNLLSGRYFLAAARRGVKRTSSVSVVKNSFSTSTTIPEPGVITKTSLSQPLPGMSCFFDEERNRIPFE